MEYHEAADRLFGLRRFRPDPGTDATAALLHELDDPHESFDCVQIAGSNGKGSTAKLLAEILEAAGYRVGLYTSPHLETIRERIQVDGQPIRKHEIVEYVDTVDSYLTDRAADGESPTFFETLTGMALWQFARENVDIAVLEVGIGGRYDATSAVDPVASAVTSVTLEHTDLLGDTISEIARDKATIALADTPLITATTGSALDVIRDTVPAIHRVGTDDDADTVVEYRGRVNELETQLEIRGPGYDLTTRSTLIGRFQAVNAGVAAALARQVASVDADVIATGIHRTTWPGRMERMDTDPHVILDGAHNPGACRALADTLGEFDYEALHLVVGAMHDKDLRGMAAALPTAASVHACAATVDRAADPDVVARVFERRDADVSVTPPVEDALTAARDRAQTGDAVVVCGSLAVVAEARRHWTRTAIPRTRTPDWEAGAILATADVPAHERSRLSGQLDHRVIQIDATTPHVDALTRLATHHDLTTAVSGIAGVDREPVPVVFCGSRQDFDRFAATLADSEQGLGPYATTLRSVLDTPESDLAWGDGPALMGILNVTPDSFHDGGQFDTVDAAVTHARELVAAGADIVDVGGESTRPGADPVPVETERERVLPVIEAIGDLDAAISVDTRRADVARPALDAGATIVNDVSGLGDPAMRFTVADHDATLVIMHSANTPVDPDYTPTYDDVVTDVIADLVETVHRATQAGIDRSQLIVDPGLGFGKSPVDSFRLLDRIDEFHALGCPVMVGHSHKSMFDAAGFDAGDREIPTVAATTLAVDRGADIVRVHDVAPNRAALDTITATTPGRPPSG